ncbi:MAG: alanine racemase [Candidatus Doudnabacteria bacterium]|nr:alanine racemase [Candidatus Doudnabacteria bacterium]
MNASLSWVEISKSALIHNAKQLRKVLIAAPTKLGRASPTKSGRVSLMAVVKSNAYGHGAFAVSSTLEDYVDSFGTANGTEALTLRQFGIKKPILVLNYYRADQVKSLIERHIALVVYDLKQAKLIAETASKLKKKAKVHIKVGTGLSRLGVYAKDAVGFVKQVSKFSQLEIEGIFSHFASSEDDPAFTVIQLNHFRSIIEALEQNLIFIPVKHIACTASALSVPESHFDLVRIGIGLYGLQSYKSIHSLIQKANPGFNLQPALTWKAKVLAVKEIPKGA